MNDLAKQIWEDGTRMVRAQAELAQRDAIQNVGATVADAKAPRHVWLLWNGYVVLLGVFLSEARAKRELEQYLSHNPTGDLWLEQRVAHQ